MRRGARGAERRKPWRKRRFATLAARSGLANQRLAAQHTRTALPASLRMGKKKPAPTAAKGGKGKAAAAATARDEANVSPQDRKRAERLEKKEWKRKRDRAKHEVC